MGGRRGNRGGARRLPPARVFLAIAVQAFELRYLEKASHISAGGMAGLAIATAHWSGLTVGAVSLILRGTILLVVWRLLGRRMALWTLFIAASSSLLTWYLELLPFHALAPALALPLVLAFSYLPSSLLLSCGYSSAGFSSFLQLLRHSRIPPGLLMFAFNVVTLPLMYLAFGRLSGALSLVATLASGFETGFWLALIGRFLPHPDTIAPRRAAAGQAPSR